MQASAGGGVTFLFTDIEGSTRRREHDPERMRPALASHDAIVRRGVERNPGTVVKMSGDGVHAAFADPRDAVTTSPELQQALANPAMTGALTLRVRCAGVDERRDVASASPVISPPTVITDRTSVRCRQHAKSPQP